MAGGGVDDSGLAFDQRAFLRGAGWTKDQVRTRPRIGIATCIGDLNPCNLPLLPLVQAAREGIEAAGGIAFEFPTITIGEAYNEPTLALRNLMSMDVEEMIRSLPIDGVVLLSGCDKTVPAQIMGALSAGKPAIALTAGPRAMGRWRGDDVTIEQIWPTLDRHRRGVISDDDLLEFEGCLNGSAGTCNVMGTATTMAVIAEVIGMALPGTALLPAGSDERKRAAVATGRRAVELTMTGNQRLAAERSGRRLRPWRFDECPHPPRGLRRTDWITHRRGPYAGYCGVHSPTGQRPAIGHQTPCRP
jgi:dihydroxy-acid dehydratase